MNLINRETGMLSEDKIRKHITNKSLQNLKIVLYDITDSTNTRAREYCKSIGAELPAVFIANGQSAGRGRRGRSFDSARGAGIYISFLFDCLDYNRSLLTVKAAVKCARAVASVSGLSVGIKWVNDIFFSGKKLAGILAEGEYDTAGRQKYAIVGIGINLFKREFSPELSDIATSIEAETGASPDRDALIGRLIDEFFRDECEADILNEYRERSTVLGKEVIARRIGGGEFECSVIGITDSGALLVRTDDAKEEELVSAEISIKHKN